MAAIRTMALVNDSSEAARRASSGSRPLVASSAARLAAQKARLPTTSSAAARTSSLPVRISSCVAEGGKSRAHRKDGPSTYGGSLLNGSLGTTVERWDQAIKQISRWENLPSVTRDAVLLQCGCQRAAFRSACRCC